MSTKEIDIESQVHIFSAFLAPGSNGTPAVLGLSDGRIYELMQTAPAEDGTRRYAWVALEVINQPPFVPTAPPRIEEEAPH
jgi:hypothetical protein